MILGSGAKIVLIYFTLFTGGVKGEEAAEYPSYYETDNKTMVLEFPYDRNTNTFASTTFIAQEEMTDFTMCFAII